MADEIELKLELSPSAAVAIEASGLLPGGSTRARQSSIYFDTPDHALDRAGVSLRIRKSEGKRVQTIKAAGASTAGLFARSEWERAVMDDIPVFDAATSLPNSLDDCIDTIAPIFEVGGDRRSWIIAEGDATIEVVLDRGDVAAGDRQSSICEIELELKSGAPSALFALARKLDAVAPVRLGVLTKAERGYRLAGPAPAMFKAEPVLLADGTAPGRAFAIVAQSCIRQFRLNEALLLAEGSAGALHQARVALRRLRSAFSIFRPIIGELGSALAADLRWLAAELGEARNLDVLLARTRPGSLHDHVALARDAAYRRVGEVLEMPRTRQLMLDLAEWIARAGWPGPAEEDLPARAYAVAALDHCYRRARKRGRKLAGLDDADRHEARKAAKKLRYAAEFLGSLFVRKRDRRRYAEFIASLQALQDQLGALNDLAMAALVLEKLGVAGDAEASRLTAEGQKKKLLRAAEAAHGQLFDLKRFWR
ncbi:CYTH and CHAD domain-containing protein [Sphingopyxis chilensis]